MDLKRRSATAEEIQGPTILSRLWELTTDQWFLFVLIVLVIFSPKYKFREPSKDSRRNLTIAVIFFINGLATQTQDLMANIRHWYCHVFI
ncbi:hypothetical protein PG988_002402 [Apiospora saccharicola]